MANPLGNETGQSKEEDVREAQQLLDLVTDDAEGMTPKEQEFVYDMQERFDQYQEQTFISPRQLFWLRSIRDRVCGL
ncbi:hypothetical protein LCGC14_1348470 [marine sediment metagenome]|uniref:Uncharacterized protein n=1 Tax=marine sediment metagenome TaxID=412755 RepID=A0A0F9MSE0_9ZZZZ